MKNAKRPVDQTAPDLPIGATAAQRILEISYSGLLGLRRRGVLPGLLNSSGHYVYRRSDVEGLRRERERRRS